MCGLCAKKKNSAAVFFSSSFVAEKKRRPDNPVLQQKRGSQIICFWVYFYRKVFLYRSDSEDSFRVRSSSTCLDLMLDLLIIFYSLYLDDFIVFGILKCIF